MTTIAELLPWLQLLIVPCAGLLLRIEHRLATIEAQLPDLRERVRRLERRTA